MTPTQGEHAQTEALPTITRYKIGYPTDSWGERSSTPGGIPDFAGTWVRYADHAAELRRLHAQVAALTAQLAAPQGVAYADAHGAIMGAAYDFRDAHISGSPNQKRSAHAALESAVTHALRASNGQSPATRITVEQVEDAIGLQSTAWDTIGAEKIVEAVLRLANGQAPAGATNTKTHALLSTMIGLFLRAKEKIGYQPGSAIDKTVAEAVEQLKDWPYPETATAQAAPAAGAVAGPTRAQIRDVFLANGFTVKEGQTDLKPYVYAAAEALLALAAAPTPAAQADSVLAECGNCFEGKSDFDHVCKHCGGSGKVADSVLEDAAFEAVRKKLCALPRYSFVLDDDGLVRRVLDRSGNWIEFDEAHALFDPISVDAARKQ